MADDLDVAFAGLAGQAELIATKQLSPRELVDLCLARIERIDPELNAFRVVYADRARAAADAAAELVGGPSSDDKPLLGVPVAVKDDMDVAGDVTGWGSSAHAGPREHDCELVARLRTAGAIVIGKTNVPELTIFPFTESEAQGDTRNPWNPAHTTGGSSGGSAAAVAAGLVAAATGSDGGGSIRIPAACCGLFGIKPHRGRISLAPRREAWNGLSVVGPLVRRVADAALFLDAVAGPAPGDVESAPPTGRSFREAASTEPGPLRIAMSAKVPPGLRAPLGAEQRASLQRTEELLRSLGHSVGHDDPEYGRAALTWVRRWVKGIHDDAHGMAHYDRLEPRTRAMARAGALVSDKRLANLRRAEQGDAARINRIFERFDVVVTPALATAPPPVGRWRGAGATRTFLGVGAYVPFNAVWNHIGQPAATVPVGFDSKGLPLSIQLLGRAGDEATLLSLAAQIESAQPWAIRRPALAA